MRDVYNLREIDVLGPTIRAPDIDSFQFKDHSCETRKGTRYGYEGGVLMIVPAHVADSLITLGWVSGRVPILSIAGPDHPELEYLVRAHCTYDFLKPKHAERGLCISFSVVHHEADRSPSVEVYRALRQRLFVWMCTRVNRAYQDAIARQRMLRYQHWVKHFTKDCDETAQKDPSMWDLLRELEQAQAQVDRQLRRLRGLCFKVITSTIRDTAKQWDLDEQQLIDAVRHKLSVKENA